MKKKNKELPRFIPGKWYIRTTATVYNKSKYFLSNMLGYPVFCDSKSEAERVMRDLHGADIIGIQSEWEAVQCTKENVIL